MNFDYKLNVSKLGSLLIQIQPNPLIKGEYEALDIVLDTDIRGYSKALIRIDEVLSGKLESAHLGGDIACAEFDKDTTRINIEASSDDRVRCTLPTWLFREIVEVWQKERKR